jgi:hypothetical protein
MTLFIGGFLIPFMLLIFFNILILLTLRAKNRSLITKFIKIGNVERRETGSIMRLESRQSTTVNVCLTKLSDALLGREIKATRMMMIFVGCYCLAWFPYAIIVLVANFAPDVNYITPLMASLPSLFAKTSSIFNALVYTLSNPKCQNHFKKLFYFYFFYFKFSVY